MIHEEVEAADRLGLDVKLTNEIPLPFRTLVAARFESQATFHPREYLLALARKVGSAGACIFEGTRVTGVTDGEPCVVTTEHGTVRARAVVVATHTPVSNLFFIHTKQAQYRSYVIGARMRTPIADALFWDTADPYHYIRSHAAPDGDFLVVGGADHKVGAETDTDAHFARLGEFLTARFGAHPIEHRWSAQVVETVDGLPYIGRNSFSRNVYVATGFAGNGLTFGTFAGMLITDLIMGVDTPYRELFDATRVKPIASIGRYLRENATFPAHLVADRVRRIQSFAPEEIGIGEGKLMELDGETLACSRDEEGRLIALSAVCTHLGCHVAWNHAEKTWDCPCHGSRFRPTGEVIDGPAVMPLARKAVRDAAAERPGRRDVHDRRPHPPREREREV